MNWLKTGGLGNRGDSEVQSSSFLLSFPLRRFPLYFPKNQSKKHLLEFNIFFCQIDSATVLYDQPPEFFHPALLEEKHEVKHIFLCEVLMKNPLIQ